MMSVKNNNSRIKVFSLLLIACMQIVVSCCNTEIDEAIQGAEELPVQFSFLMPEEEVVTRAKTAFAKNDLVYVTAIVLVDDGENEPTYKQRSTILKYDGSQWNVRDAGTVMSWPLNAVSADFTAYYLPKIADDEGFSIPNDPLTESPTVINLGQLKNETDDPLIAKRKNIKANGMVTLQFAHTTTKLLVTGLKHNQSAKLTTKVTLYNDNEACALTNQFVLSYSEENGYEHSFLSDGTREITQTVEPKDSSRIVFFLNVDPDMWLTHKEQFRIAQKNDEGQLTTEQPTNLSEVNLYSMKAGSYYHIYFLSGSISGNLSEEKKWDEESTKITFNNAGQIENYFAGLTDGKLTDDLDFNNIPLTEGIHLPGLRSDLRADTKPGFNGNYRTIYNVCIVNGFFEPVPSNYEVKNLRIENITVQASALEYTGLLTPLNEGTITNVHIGGVNVLGANNIPYVGGLVGLNKGTLSGVSISGILTIDCSADNGALYVGGLVGANGSGNTGKYTIENSKVNGGVLITVAGDIESENAHIGGFAGFSGDNKSITKCNTTAIVNAADVKAGNCYIGGFIGLNRGKIQSCDASGNVTGGTATADVALGGFAGYTTSRGKADSDNIATINGGSASGNIYETDNQERNSYVGGFCGYAEIDILNSSSVGNVQLSSVANSNRNAGAMIGILSAEKTIINSFSITSLLSFTGVENSLAANCHLRGKMLNDKSEITETDATAARLNNTRKADYWEWTSSGIYNGVPYLVKQ